MSLWFVLIIYWASQVWLIPGQYRRGWRKKIRQIRFFQVWEGQKSAGIQCTSTLAWTEPPLEGWAAGRGWRLQCWDWFSWEKFNRKPSIFPGNMGLSCRISLKPIHWLQCWDPILRFSHKKGGRQLDRDLGARVPGTRCMFTSQWLLMYVRPCNCGIMGF